MNMKTTNGMSRKAAKPKTFGGGRVGLKLLLAVMPPVPAAWREAAQTADARADWFASQAREARGLGRDGTAAAFERRARECRREALRELNGFR